MSVFSYSNVNPSHVSIRSICVLRCPGWKNTAAASRVIPKIRLDIAKRRDMPP